MVDSTLLEIKQEVESAVSLIKAQHAGSNLSEAKRLLSEAGEAVKGDRFDNALELARKSQLMARPNTEYLLQSARDLAMDAEKEFTAKKYDDATGLWKKALEEYSRARELATERGEGEVVTKIDEVEGVIQENISNSDVSHENAVMLELVSTGSKKVEEGNGLFGEGQFEDARNAYEEGKDAYRKAAKIATERDFTDDGVKIEEALRSVSSSINATYLKRAETLLTAASDDLSSNNLEDAEKRFSEVVEYVEGLKDVEGLDAGSEAAVQLEKGHEGLLRTKLQQGRNQMEEAQSIFNNGKFYDAKEAYKSASAHLDAVRDEAIQHKLQDVVSDLHGLINVCTQNINLATDSLMGVGRVDATVIRVEDVGRGTGTFVLPTPATSPVGGVADRLRRLFREMVYIGGGGFADVYKVERKDGSIVAIKVPRNLDSKTEDIFFRELDSWKKLKHPNIVRLIKPHLTPIPYLETEYIDGGSLQEALDQHPDRSGGTLAGDAPAACRVAYNLASALQHSHAKNVIHSDLSPKNILLTKDGEPKITDFGLSKVASSSSEIAGLTRAYASKEQLDKRMADERTDVYQLGLLFYCMLAGENPFESGSVYETEERVRTLVPDPPSVRNRAAGPLDDLVLRCLSKEASERPSLREFRETVYEFVKKGYGESLHLTEDTGTLMRLACNYAMMAASQDDGAQCLLALKSAQGKVRDQDKQKELGNMIQDIEHRVKEGMKLDPIVERMRVCLRDFGG